MRAERTAGRDSMREMAGCPDRLAQAMHGGREVGEKRAQNSRVWSQILSERG